MRRVALAAELACWPPPPRRRRYWPIIPVSRRRSMVGRCGGMRLSRSVPARALWRPAARSGGCRRARDRPRGPMRRGVSHPHGGQAAECSTSPSWPLTSDTNDQPEHAYAAGVRKLLGPSETESLDSATTRAREPSGEAAIPLAADRAQSETCLSVRPPGFCSASHRNLPFADRRTAMISPALGY
jgi:hypothetical protein